jgi:methionyl-tRNA formyltransferase
MKTIFMGTPVFAAESLKAVLSRHEVLAVFTQPDRPAGRGHRLQASPVKELAAAHGIPVFQPPTLRLSEAKDIREELKNFGADIFVVAAYGLLLPKGVLAMPPKGCINVHASLLPKYRGASPIHSAILNGDTETGITIMHMDVQMDTGDIVLQKKLALNESEHFPQLHDRMAALGGEALLEAMDLIESGAATRTPQNHALATHCAMIKKTDGEINWNDSTEKILNKIRAFDPWPGCYTTLFNQPLKIWQANTTGGGIAVKTGDGEIFITELQAAGKKRMPASAFLLGQR